jgi:type IV pilus assembly protein PilF
MRITLAGVGRAPAGLAWAVLAGGTLLAGLAGCASRTADMASTPSEIVTPSDEPESRRRARIRLELASVYFNEGKTDIALDELKQAITNDPTLADAYVLRGLIYMRLNDMRQAEDSFRRAVSLNPRDSNAYHNLGWLQCQLGRYPGFVPLVRARDEQPVVPGQGQVADGDGSVPGALRPQRRRRTEPGTLV